MKLLIKKILLGSRQMLGLCKAHLDMVGYGKDFLDL